MRQNKRKLKRQDIFLIVEFKSLKNSGGGSIGITRELSTEGFSMEAQNIEFKCGEILEFTLKHSGSDQAVTIEGEVAWKDHSWYKYIIGVKFLEVTEEQKGRIEDLMSAIRDVKDEPYLTSDDNESIPERREEDRPAAGPAPEQNNTLIPDIPEREKRIPLRMTEHSELTGRERNFISGEKFPVSDDDVHEEGKPSSTTKERGQETPGTAQFDRIKGMNKRRTAAQRISGNMYGAGKERKKKILVYAPLVTAAAVFLFIALPVMIKSFNAPSPDDPPALTEPAIPAHGEHEEALAADERRENSVEYVTDTPGPDMVTQAREHDPVVSDQDEEVNVMQLSSGEDFTEPVSPPSPPEGAVRTDNVREIMPDVPGEEASKIDLIATIDETIKNVQAMRRKKPVLRRRTPAATWTADGNADNAEAQRSSIDGEIVWTGEPQERVTPAGTIETPEAEIPVKNETADEPARVITAEVLSDPSPIVRAERLPEPEAIKIKETLDKIEQPIIGGEQHKVGLVVKNKESSETRLLAKRETPGPRENRVRVETPEPGATLQNVPKIALLVKGGIFKKNRDVSPAQDSKVNRDSSKGWKYIGSAQNGIPLYIDPGTISYPSEQVVNVLMRASVNNKDYIDMLAINCSQSMLRILEERDGKNPVMSAYSDEWRDITPESMVLYTSTCPQQK